MRINRSLVAKARASFSTFLAILFMVVIPCAGARAQSAGAGSPDASSQKALDLLEQTIQAMGGSAYLNLRDSSCQGRLSAFGHSGDLTGLETYFELTRFPDKRRIEHSKKRNIAEVFNGNKGWELDKAGVSDAPAEQIKDWDDHLKRDINQVLRYRIHEPGMILSFAGTDVVDLKEVNWVEMTDSDDRQIRLALDAITHLPVKEIVNTQDPVTLLRIEQVYYFSNYHSISGIETPFQVSGSRNGLRTYQTFIDTCSYNTGLSDSLFTRESLEERWAQVGKGKFKL